MNGNVDITVSMRGTGDAPRKATETKQAIDGVTKSSDEAGRSLDNTGKRMKALKSASEEAGGGISGLRSRVLDMAEQADNRVLKVRDGFRKLGEVVGLAGGAVGIMGGLIVGAVSGLAEWIGGANRAAVALEKWKKNQAELNAALERGRALTDDGFKSAPLEAALTDVNIQLARARALIGDIKSDKEEWVKRLREINALQTVQLDLERKIRAETEKRAQHWTEIRESMERAKILDLTGIHPFIQASSKEGEYGYDPSLLMDVDPVSGETLTEEEKKRRKRALDEKLAKLRAPKRAKTLREALLSKDQRAIDAFYERDRGQGLAANDNYDSSRMRDYDIDASDAYVKNTDAVRDYSRSQQDLSERKTLEARGKVAKNEEAYTEARKVLERESLGEPIRDFSLALAEALPNMDSFTGALGKIGAQWDAYSKGQKSLASTVTGSVGALAKAGAEHIKNERLRAGVLAIIETGLGIATSFTNPAESASHFGAAVTLGSVAIFGGSSSSGGSKQERNVMRSTASAPQSAAPTVNIYGGWLGNGTPQENAYALYERMRAAYGTGFVPAFQEAA